MLGWLHRPGPLVSCTVSGRERASRGKQGSVWFDSGWLFGITKLKYNHLLEPLNHQKLQLKGGRRLALPRDLYCHI